MHCVNLICKHSDVIKSDTKKTPKRNANLRLEKFQTAQARMKSVTMVSIRLARIKSQNKLGIAITLQCHVVR